MKKIVLASSSPRRKEILDKMSLDYEIILSDYEESLDNPVFAYEKIEKLAFEKAQSVVSLISYPALVIAADTVVVYNDTILGKPSGEEHAFQMLCMLNNAKHSVVTSVCVVDTESKKYKILSTTSYVEFNNLSEQQIKDYVQNFKPLDKAGSYGIQELPPYFVKSVDGSFENIIGLCSTSLKEVLDTFN